MKISIDSAIKYAGRVLAVISVAMPDKTYKVGMYRSTGRNVEGKGNWFPTAGTVMSHPTFKNPKGRAVISKDLLVHDGTALLKLTSSIDNKRDHADPTKRLEAFDQYKDKGTFSFDMKELSASVEMVFSDMERRGQVPYRDVIKDGMSEERIFTDTTSWIVSELTRGNNLPLSSSQEMTDTDDMLQDTRIKLTR